MDPIVKWAGGKRKQANTLSIFMLKKCNTYIEPFFGGGGVFFKRAELGLKHKKAIINDTNKELMSMYRQVRDNPEEVYSKLIDLKERYENRAASSGEAANSMFLRAREIVNEYLENDPNSVPAELFIFINKVGFNGLYRKNKSGLVNTPYGKRDTFSIPKEENFFKASNYLKNVQITSVSFEEILDLAKHGDTVYCDPPYWPVKQNSFVSYTSSGFDAKDHNVLAEKVKELQDKDINVIVSNSNCKIVKELYQYMKVEKIMAPRSINSNGRGRGKVKELIFY